MNFIDRYQSTLASSYTSGGSSMSVTSASGLPTGICYFFVIVRSEGANTEEVLLVTNVSGTTLTVTGAQAGTSASNHAGGATIIGSIMTTAAFSKLAEPDIISFEKAGGTVGTTKVEASALGTSATTTLLNISNGPGYLSTMSIFFTAASDFSTSAQSSTLKITVDGNIIYNDRIALYFGAEYAYNTGNHRSMFNSTQTNNSNNIGYNSFIPIPYNSTLKVELTNGSSSGALTVWANFTYQTGITNNWPRTRNLKTAVGTSTNNAVNTVKTLVDVSSLNPGRLLGVFISIDSFPNSANPATAPMEGNIKIYLDGAGSPTCEYSGFEDYFLWSNYFEGYAVPSANSIYKVDQYWSGLQFASTSGAVTWNAYRYHIPDKILFSNALKITYNCGDSSQVNFTGGVRVAWCVWYYTE